MPDTSRIPSLLLASATLLLGATVSAAAEQCPKGEQALEFRFFTDNNSWKDNGWIMECDYQEHSKELVWSVPIGSLKFADHTEVIREAACVPDTATCYLNLFDASGDGLQGNKNGDPSTNAFAGWFAFLHGATTVATYKGLDDPSFGDLSYCVGPKCEKKPQEVQDEENCHDLVYLAMQLDNSPGDTSYQLMCGGETLWDGKGFTEAGAYVEETTCLPKDACCEFLVVDSKNDGLTETVVETAEKATRTTVGSPLAKGFIYLEKNYEPVLEYDGNTGDTFGVLTKRFNCDAANDKDQEKKEKEPVKDEEEEKTKEEENIDTDKDGMDVEVGDNLEGVFNQIGDNSVEVGDNLDGVFQPEPEEVQEVSEEELEEVSEEESEEESVSEDSKDTDKEESGTQQQQQQQVGNNGMKVNDMYVPLSTFVPTSENWVQDDDFQNHNDDGKWFGNWNKGNNKNGDDFTDDVFRTDRPTLYGSGTDAPTWAPTSVNTGRVFYDDVVDDDDKAWAMMDDLKFPIDGMFEMDGLIQDITDHTPKLATDPNAAMMLNGEPVYRKEGLHRNAKITLGVLIPLFVLWTIGLLVFHYRETPFTRKDEESEEVSSEDGGEVV